MNTFFPAAAAAIATLASIIVARPVAAEDIPQPLLLWPEGAPGASGDSDEDKPAIYPFTLSTPLGPHNAGAAVLVCPGGAMTTRCIDQEGVLVARWLNQHGIAAFVLRYRIRPLYDVPDAVADFRRGVQYLRSHAAEFKIDPNRIGMIGFSAGAEQACRAVIGAPAGDERATDPAARVSSNPNFLLLVYGSAPFPAAASGGDNAPQSATHWPPTFMFCTAEDASHITGMVRLYSALLTVRVPVEAHFFQDGEHGVGLAQGDPVLGEYPNLMLNWLRHSGFLTHEPRQAVRGIVKIDGQPLAHGLVTLTPIDNAAAPTGVGYVLNTGPVRGRYDIPAAQGPIAGRYRVEIREDATRWTSNAQNPMVRRYGQYRQGTEEQKHELADYARSRDLSPSIDAQHVFRRAHPGDADELTVEIKAGQQNEIDLEVFLK